MQAASKCASCLSSELQTNLTYSYQPYKARITIPDLDSEDDNDIDDELDWYLRLKPASLDQCPNLICGWLDRKADYPNLFHMAVDYLIIPSMYWYFWMPNITYLVSLATSVDAERAFSACTLAFWMNLSRLVSFNGHCTMQAYCLSWVNWPNVSRMLMQLLLHRGRSHKSTLPMRIVLVLCQGRGHGRMRHRNQV